MHERTLQDLYDIIRRDVYPMGAMPNERQHTARQRAEYLTEEVVSLIKKNKLLEELVAIAYTLGSSGCFEIGNNEASKNDATVLEILASRKLISREPVVVYKSRSQTATSDVIADQWSKVL